MTIISWMSAVALPAAAFLYLFSPPTFVASADVLIPLTNSPGNDPKVSAAVAPDTLIDGQIKLLESDRILQQVIDRFGLWEDPEISKRGGALGGVLSNSVVGSEGRDGHRKARVAAFRERLEVASLTPAPAMRVSYSSADPNKAAAIATGVAETYIETVTAELRQEAQQAESHLAQRLTRLQERAGSTPHVAADRSLQGNDSNARRQQLEAALNASLYGSTLAQYADVVRGSKPASSAPRIVRAALPSRGDRTSRLAIVALALGVGGLIGFLSAVRRETASRPVRSTRDLGVPSLGSVALVPGRRLLPKRTIVRPLLLHDDRDHLRALLLRLRRDANGGGALVLGIVSALEGEGTSTIAFNLAVLGAENGERALLVDMDLHNCSLTNALTNDGEGRLLDAIDGKCKLQDAIVHTEHGFDALGQRSIDEKLRPVSVLASQKMDALLSRARLLYDIVICDLPPAVDHADIGAMSDTIDRFVFVAEWGRTPTVALEHALQQSPLIERRILGVLLNKAPPRA